MLAVQLIFYKVSAYLY